MMLMASLFQTKNNMKNCLVVIDMQNDFISGSLGSENAKAIVSLVKIRIEKAIADGEDLIFTKDTHFKDYLNTKEGKNLPIEHCLDGTWGHEICDELLPYTKKALTMVDKNTFGYKDLPLYTSKYENITLIGLCTDVCIISNAMLLKAFYPEKEIIIEKSLCAGTSVEKHEIALKAMEACQFTII